MIRNLNDFYGNFKKSLPVLWKYFYFVQDCAKKHMQEYIENGKYAFFDATARLELLTASTDNKDCKDSDSEENGEICFHCQ